MRRSSSRPACFRPSPPCPARLPPSSDSVRMAVFPRRPFSRSTTRSRPPVPFVCCSFRSWFVSPFRFVFSSARFQLVQFPFVQFVFRSVQLVRFCFVQFGFSSVSVRFQLVCVRICVHERFIYIFSRILYTTKGEFQMYFLPKNMSFLRIVQIIDIKSKKFDAFGHLFQSSPRHRGKRRNGKKQALIPHSRTSRRKRRGTGSAFRRRKKKTCHPRHQNRCRNQQKSLFFHTNMIYHIV